MADATTPAPPKRRVPFKRTIARRKSPSATGDTAKKSKIDDDDDDDDDGLSMFRRQDPFADVLEEQEQRLKKKEQRRFASVAIKTSPGQWDVKRRKVSIDGDEDGQQDSPLRPVGLNRDSVPGSTSKPKALSPTFSDDNDFILDVKGTGREILRRKESPKTRMAHRLSPPVISLDDEDFAASPPTTATVRGDSFRSPQTRSQRRASYKHEVNDGPIVIEDSPPRSTGVLGDGDDDDDDDLKIEDGPPVIQEEPDEFEEYIRRARERAEERERQEKLKQERENQTEEMKPGGHISFEENRDTRAGSHRSDSDEPIIKIMVTSVISGSKKMMMKRRYNQPLGMVRDTWAQRQQVHIPMDMWDDIFLTFKGNRVYTTSTCASLGVNVARLNASDAEWDRKNGFHKDAVHLEAWTEELYQEHEKKKERERLRLLGQLDDDDDEDNVPGSATEGAVGGAGGEEEASTKVILKAKNYEPLRVKVHAQTTVDEMIAAFRKTRKVAEGSEISLFFDGEKLDGDMAVQDTEIEDMDNLEVHVK